MKSNVAIRTCGWIWLFTGVLLLRKGLDFANQLGESSEPIVSSKVFTFLCENLGNSKTASMALVVIALAIGFMKSRRVMTKAANRNIERLMSMETVPVTALFDTKMWILIAAMMGLGLLINRLGLSYEWRVLIDVAVGSALMMGSAQYLKAPASSKA